MANKVVVPKELKYKLKKLKKKNRNIKIKKILISPFSFLINLFNFKNYKKIFYDEYADEDEKEQELESQKGINPKSIFRDAKPFIDFEEEESITLFNSQKLKPTFYDLIIRFADKLNISDSDLYKKAYVDRRLFSKIRQGHKPNIKTVIRLGLALELNENDFTTLLNSCNYSLYEDKYFDIAIKYFVKNKIYDINRCNDILYSCKLDLLNEYE